MKEKFEIYYNDLNEDAKEKYLKFNQISDSNDIDLDVNIVPICVVEKDIDIEVYSTLDTDPLRIDEAIKEFKDERPDYENLDHYHPSAILQKCEELRIKGGSTLISFNPIVLKWIISNKIKIKDFITGDSILYSEFTDMWREIYSRI